MIKNIKLKTLFEFQHILCDMQQKIIEANKKNIPSEVIKSKLDLYERIHSVYREYDKFYFEAEYEKEQNFQLKKELEKAHDKINDLKNNLEKITTFYELNDQK